MAGFGHNVDICVTCVTDKPPRLPLREELPSLGIEVVYNGQGVGAEAVEEERRKAIIKNHKKMLELQEKMKLKDAPGKSTISPPGKALLDAAIRKVSGKEKEDPPTGGPIMPKAISYGEYHNKLALRADPSGDSHSMGSSIETTPTMKGEFPNIKTKKKSLGISLFKKKNSKEPPSSVSIPKGNTIEDAALAEAFDAFTATIKKQEDKLKEAFDALPPPVTKNDMDESIGNKDETFPDLLPGAKSNPEKIETDTVSDSAPETSGASSSGIEQTTVSSLGADENSSMWNNSAVNDAESFTKRAKDMLERMAAERLAPMANNEPLSPAQKSTGGNIRVKLLSNTANDHITEIYDLTDISERDEANSALEDQDMFPDNLLQSDVLCHGETLPISPFTFYSHQHSDETEYSEESSVPVPETNDEYGNQVLDVADIYEENGPGSPLVLSPRQDRTYAPQSFALSPSSFAIPEANEKKKNHFRPSYYHHQRRNEELFHHDHRDDLVVYRVESQAPPNAREKNSPIARMPTFDEAVRRYYESRSPTHPALSPSTGLTPAIRKTASRDSHDLKVSFSQDVEEHYFDKNQYDFSGVKSSLAAVLNQNRGLNDPLPLGISEEADKVLEDFADNLNDDNRSPEQILLQALSFGDPLPFDFQETIQLNPSIASRRLPDVDTTALHAACLRAFPKRFGKDQTCRIKDLIEDLSIHRKLIEALVTANPASCRSVDINGDLPVHIMARKLMEWEGRWYQKVYEKAKNQDVEDNGSGITRLYQSMSECINTLLQPISEDDSLCLQSGSVGRILPLHIAAIFTVAYDTLKSILVAFPNAATMKCDLSDIKTFVPTDSTPLQLHDRLSTDFPKWEIQQVKFNPDEVMTQAMLDEIYRTSNGIRRSDLMFAFSPKLLPYRKEEYRIRRMEQMIVKEMKEHEETGDYVMTLPAKVFWMWMCEFQDDNDVTDNYAESVLRVVDRLPYAAVRFLSSVTNEEGIPVIDIAMPKCARIIMDRLDKIVETDIPIRVKEFETPKSALLRQFDEEISSQFRLKGQGFVGPLCRTLFHVDETVYPSSFILLPYKLVKDSQGRLGLESSKAARIAMEFADCLSRLTAPKNILYTLDQKIHEFLGSGLIDTMNRENRESQHKRKEQFEGFLKLYKDQPAYFYFIDDCTGIPIVDESDGVYPLMVPEPREIVEKVFPLMLSGMILMRGQKAFPILAEVLLDENIKLVLPNWIDAAKDLVGYAFSIATSKPPILSLLPMRKNLLEFIQYGSTENDVTTKFSEGGLSSEWVVEISLIKMLIEMYDPKHVYSGLLQERSATQVLWTQDPGILKDSPLQIDFVSSKSLKANIGDELTYSKESAGSYSSEYSTEDERPGMIISTASQYSQGEGSSRMSDYLMNTPTKETVKTKSPPSLECDDELEMNSVTKLQLRLEAQEATLEALRKKIADLDSASDELIQQEERISDMIDEIIDQKDQMTQIPAKNGVDKARALLLRICQLEDRVLCREVEVGQLKNDVSCFELETSDKESSSRSQSNENDDASSQPDGAEDETNSDADSTMYNSSMEGYPTGMLKN